VKVQFVNLPQSPIACRNLIGGEWMNGSGSEIKIHSPYTGHQIGVTNDSTIQDAARAVKAAHAAFPAWKQTPIKERCRLLFEFRQQVMNNIEELSHLVAAESGKTVAEGKAGILKGLEVTEFALSLQNMDSGGIMNVSRGVSCEVRHEPIGVVVGIVPFNFPAMVPMWMFPIALACGNCFVLKPSEKVPLTMTRIAELIQKAGFPAGVFSVVQGKQQTVEALIDAPEVKAVAFVGSSPVALSLYKRATALSKRALCLGGAKNPIILAPDADPAVAVDGILKSFTGCAGQRCMAASVLLAVGNVDNIISGVVEQAKKMVLGSDMGAIIDRAAMTRIENALAAAEKAGAKIVLDGRKVAKPAGCEGGFWIGPTIIDHANADMACAKEEIFGPIVTVVRVKTLAEAMRFDAVNSYGNATSVFTTSGAVADYVTTHSTAGMIGVNIGVPVPREPFSFGGTKDSKYGHGDITGESAVEFWTDRRKVTRKWEIQRDSNWMS
jgi:malonate-semialdehyde dehydrogenase (acetylating)/methylmalonate-semialdehyde dehydrogenase